ncbi:uncharacterized protein LOC118755513 [Rhagoletis pomonella]|uniref:uncharacterized protein LOC118755216 n=1 Tax=Rhagoletis pomonella TaxID=28610 RepID=UPI0017848C0C|nr:uncharacterized protein LOC118755216 [Rhagoletis pomonella]XP_036346241.1 uncharacterized protein LOC118755513 [Rhagoletis pomonella]
MENLKQKRQVIKGSITRIYTFCLNQNASLDEVKVRISKLDELFSQYEEIQNSIDDLAGPSQDEEVYRSEKEDKYFATKSIFANRVREDESNRMMSEHPQGGDKTRAMQSLMDHQTTRSALIERISNSTGMNAASSPFNQPNDRNTRDKHEIRLPHIQIPEFDGTYTEWIRFRDLFEAMIHTRANLSDVERFEYLQTRLKGDALSLVKHLRPTNDPHKS